MKRSRILTVILVCAAALLVLCACGKGGSGTATGGSAKDPKITIDPEAVVSVTDAKQLVGTWTTTPIDFTDSINEQLGATLSEDTLEYFRVGSFSYCLTFTFTPEGYFSMQPDSDSVDASIDGIKEDFAAGVAKMYTDLAESQGAKVEDVVDAIGYESLDALVEYTLTAFDFDQIKFNINAPLNVSGNYDVVEGRVVLLGSVVDDVHVGTFDACFKNGRLFFIPPTDTDENLLFDRTLTLIKTE